MTPVASAGNTDSNKAALDKVDDKWQAGVPPNRCERKARVSKEVPKD